MLPILLVAYRKYGSLARGWSVRANQACSNGPLADNAKKGRPIENANRPSSHSASPSVGGRPQLAAMATGSARVAASIKAIWMNREIRVGAQRVNRCA